MKHYKGFSIIELIVTLAVFAILSSMALVFSGAFLQDNRISTSNNDLVGSINLARSTAVSRGTRTSICASNDGATCTNTVWELGWIVFIDGGTAGTVDGDDSIIKVNNNAAIDISITSLSAFIQFKPQGAVVSTCVSCFDKTLRQRFETIFAAVGKTFSPVSSVYASGSGDGGSSGSSGGVVLNCTAPESKVKSGGSSSGDSGGSSLSNDSLNSYKDHAFNLLQQLSPIATAQAGEQESSKAESKSSTATCDNGSGSAQVEIPAQSFLICDSSRHLERGSLISVSVVGRVSREKTSCN